MSVKPGPKGDDSQGDTSAWGLAMGAGMEIAVSVLAGFFLGLWLDKKLGTTPWLMIAGALSGICVGLYQLVKVAARRGSGS